MAARAVPPDFRPSATAQPVCGRDPARRAGQPARMPPRRASPRRCPRGWRRRLAFQGARRRPRRVGKRRQPPVQPRPAAKRPMTNARNAAVASPPPYATTSSPSSMPPAPGPSVAGGIRRTRSAPLASTREPSHETTANGRVNASSATANGSQARRRTRVALRSGGGDDVFIAGGDRGGRRQRRGVCSRCWVTVSGELGTGKTTFVRGSLRALGVEGPVTSPTTHRASVPGPA